MRFGFVLFAVLVLGSSAIGLPSIGRLDTIGGTAYDYSVICAGIQRMVYYDSGYGIHVTWCWSEQTTGTTFTDRNVRYNFRDETTGAWKWLDADYMHSGVNVFGQRSGYGAMDLDPSRHVITVSRHYAFGSDLVSSLARDVAPGQGAFEYADDTQYVAQWPWHAVTASGKLHMFRITAEYALSYRSIANWPTWDSQQTGFSPSPGFPSHLIIGSKRSEKVAALWENCTNTPEDAYLRVSDDGGVTWAAPVQLGFPPAFGGDTAPSYQISSFGATYDRDDNLNVVAAVTPTVHDTVYTYPAEVWHYNAANSPNWHRVQRAGCDPAHLLYSLGYNSVYACRPKIGQDPTTGRLCVIWSQFDSTNGEPATERLRADVWCSTSPDGGYMWTAPVSLTGPDSCSRLYCDIAPIVNDTMHIVYISDLQAGMFVQGEGHATLNPVIYAKVPVSAVAGVEERPSAELRTPNRGPTVLSGASGVKGLSTCVVFDALGRRVLNPKSGVYFVREAQAQAQAQAIRKVVITR